MTTSGGERCLFESLRDKRREKVVCHRHIRVLGGVVYIMKSREPRTEPRGTPYSEVCKEEKQSLHFTQKV